MPVNVARTRYSHYEGKAFDYLIKKYKADPEWFGQNLPDITDMIREASLLPPRPLPSFDLKEDERVHHADGLNAILDTAEISPQDAIKGIEHCAALIQDETLTPHVNRDRVMTLFKAAYGKSPESAKKNTVILVEGGGTGEPVYHSSLLRGVVADLDLEMRLVSITIAPSKIREGKRMMRLVGIAHDSRDDVSINHDEYLAEIYYDELHGIGWRDSEKDVS